MVQGTCWTHGDVEHGYRSCHMDLLLWRLDMDDLTAGVILQKYLFYMDSISCRKCKVNHVVLLLLFWGRDKNVCLLCKYFFELLTLCKKPDIIKVRAAGELAVPSTCNPLQQGWCQSEDFYCGAAFYKRRWRLGLTQQDSANRVRSGMKQH